MKTIKIGNSALQYEDIAELKYEFTEKKIKVGKDVYFGDGCYLMTDIVIGNNVKIGKGCIINHRATIRDNVKIGNNCDIGRAAMIGSNVDIESNFSCGTGVHISACSFIGRNTTIQSFSSVNGYVYEYSFFKSYS